MEIIDIMNKRILVTGGTGFIGSHTVVELQQKGFDVVIADNLSNSFEEVVDRIAKITGVRPDFEKTELKDASQVNAIFDKHPDIQGVIHFAASKAVGESVQKPLTVVSHAFEFNLCMHICLKNKFVGVSW